MVIKNFPLQTYVSALVFSPTHSLTRELFRKEEPLWAVATPDKEWGALVQTIEIDLHFRGSVVFSPDDKMIVSASGSRDNPIKLWDAVTGELKDTLKVQHGGIGTGAVGFTSSGCVMVSESINATVRIWDAATGEINHILEGQNKSEVIISIAFSPRGRLLASGYLDGMIEIWDVVTGKLRRTLKGQEYCIMSLLFSPGGRLIALGSNGVLEIWNIIRGEAEQTVEGQAEGIISFAVSPDGIFMILGLHGGTLELWDAIKGEAKHTLRGQSESIFSVAFSPDGSLIASGSVGGTIQLWDAATREVKSTLSGHVRAIISLAFSSDGRLIISGSTDHTIKVWNVTRSQVYNALNKIDKRTVSITFSSNGKLIASWWRGEQKVRIWDAATGEIKETLEASCDIDHVIFDTEGLYIYSRRGSSSTVTNLKFDRWHCHHIDIQDEIKPRSRQDQQCRFSLDHDRSWIEWNGHRVLCLPSEFKHTRNPNRVISHSLATSNVVKLAIAYGPWKIMIITLSKSPGLPYGPIV